MKEITSIVDEALSRARGCMADRIRPAAVARMTSLSVRKVQELSVAGQIPSAAKLGALWTYDPDAVQGWIRQAERRTVQQAATARPGVTACRCSSKATLPAATTEALYERLIGSKRSSRIKQNRVP